MLRPDRAAGSRDVAERRLGLGGHSRYVHLATCRPATSELCDERNRFTLPDMSGEQHLADKACIPCRGGVPPLTLTEYTPLLGELDGWQVVDDHHLSKDFRFKDFQAALDFVNRAGAIAEEQGHHPEITVGWGHAKVEIWTHKIDGLTESDFVLAAKYDRLVG